MSLVPSWLSAGVGGLEGEAWFTGGTDEAADNDSSDTPANTKAHCYNTPFPTPLKWETVMFHQLVSPGVPCSGVEVSSPLAEGVGIEEAVEDS